MEIKGNRQLTGNIKSGETLALEAAIDDAIHFANMIKEIVDGSDPIAKDHPTIPLIVNDDSKSLIDSLHSTKKVKRKTMRVIISSLQQHMKTGRIKEINHVSSKQQLADVFTKKGVSSDTITNIVSSGTLTFD